jgi:hypothetical protein
MENKRENTPKCVECGREIKPSRGYLNHPDGPKHPECNGFQSVLATKTKDKAKS